MALPNLVGLIGLRNVVINETNEFFQEFKREQSNALEKVYEIE